MKVSKMPGFGSFGAIVEDFEWDQPEAYQELKELNLKTLVTVVRSDGIERFDTVAKNIHHITDRRPSRFVMKYGLRRDYSDVMTDDERRNTEINGRWAIPNYTGWFRVTGKKDNEGKMLGAFGDTELLWHSNEFAQVSFAPLVILYGMNHMNTSSTSFLQSADWYDKQTESFKSELNELVSDCIWNKKAIMPSSNEDQELNMRMFFVPQEHLEMPLVMDSPGGFRGLHYSKFISGFKGMSKADSDKIIAKIESELFVPEYQYDYWWDNPRGDLVLFEQSITLHMRKIKEDMNMISELHERLAYRFAGDYAGKDVNYNGFIHEDFHRQKEEFLVKMADLKQQEIAHGVRKIN